MSITPLPLSNRKSKTVVGTVLITAFSLLSGTVLPWLPITQSVQASEPSGAIRLWSESLKNGQWRAIGLGVLDSQSLGDGLKIEVDWQAATFGIGVIYEEGENGGAPLPELRGYRALRFDARATGDEPRSVTAEFVIRSPHQPGKEKAFRAAPATTVQLSEEWTTAEFQIPADFPKLQETLSEVNALRILFPKSDSSGRGQVELRNVQLIP